MILGRSPALWLALVAACMNAAVVVAGLNLTPDQIVSLNALAFAIVGFVANESDPTTAATFSLTTTRPTAAPALTAVTPSIAVAAPTGAAGPAPDTTVAGPGASPTAPTG